MTPFIRCVLHSVRRDEVLSCLIRSRSRVACCRRMRIRIALAWSRDLRTMSAVRAGTDPDPLRGSLTSP